MRTCCFPHLTEDILSQNYLGVDPNSAFPVTCWTGAELDHLLVHRYAQDSAQGRGGAELAGGGEALSFTEATAVREETMWAKCQHEYPENCMAAGERERAISGGQLALWPQHLRLYSKGIQRTAKTSGIPPFYNWMKSCNWIDEVGSVILGHLTCAQVWLGHSCLICREKWERSSIIYVEEVCWKTLRLHRMHPGLSWFILKLSPAQCLSEYHLFCFVLFCFGSWGKWTCSSVWNWTERK